MHHWVNGGGGAYLSFGSALAWPAQPATSDWAFYPGQKQVVEKIVRYTPWWKWPAWIWTRNFGAWPSSAEWLSAMFDYNVAPFFQSFVVVTVDPLERRILVKPWGVNGPLVWSDFDRSSSHMPPAALPDQRGRVGRHPADARRLVESLDEHHRRRRGGGRWRVAGREPAVDRLSRAAQPSSPDRCSVVHRADGGVPVALLEVHRWQDWFRRRCHLEARALARQRGLRGCLGDGASGGSDRIRGDPGPCRGHGACRGASRFEPDHGAAGDAVDHGGPAPRHGFGRGGRHRGSGVPGLHAGTCRAAVWPDRGHPDQWRRLWPSPLPEPPGPRVAHVAVPTSPCLRCTAASRLRPTRFCRRSRCTQAATSGR